MIKEDISNISLHSHKYVNVICDLKISPECKNTIRKMMKTVTRDRSKCDGKDVCFYCSRQIKYSGRNNPNVKFKSLDDGFLKNIDTEFKAYLLGWISSDGHISKNNSITISIHKNDKSILDNLKNTVCEELELKKSKVNMIKLTLNSKEMCSDVIAHLKLVFANNGNKKSHQIQMPDLPENLMWAFLRGHFDGDGSIVAPSLTERYPKCSITSFSKIFLQQIKDFCKIPCCISGDKILFSGNNALDFMGKLYDGKDIFLERKHNLYIMWSQWVPSLSGQSNGRELTFKWSKSRPDAVKPRKERASDSGYDIVLLEKVKSFGVVDLYDTGIKITPEFGWYFDMVPRSSIIKSGYILANSIGVIDRSYVGSIMVPLIKIDPNAPDLSPGTRLVQLIPRPIINFEMVEVDDLGNTTRNEAGFGSTGI